MADSQKIPKDKLPAFVRNCYSQWRTANKDNRDAEKLRKQFYVGGDLQWRDTELEKRRQQKRPWISINRCKPAVDQVEGDIRMNPPGPQCSPVGGGADGDTADIIEGIIREIEYRSAADTAYALAGRDEAMTGFGYLELMTEFVSERSFKQRLKIMPGTDADCVFFDPTARMANREDAGWGGKLRMYNRQEYEGQFGTKRKVLQPSSFQATKSWIMDAIGYEGDLSRIREWTGYGKPEGPFFVAEFYLVEITREKLQMYDDHICRFADDPNPKNAQPLEGEENVRDVARRKIKKYVVDALEVLDETEWLGTIIPLIPVLGPEVYIEGRLHRLSLISGAMDSQRALNYVATTATELAGLMPKSPWVGYEGQFDDPRWKNVNSEVYAFLEVKPVHAMNPTTNQSELLPPPQRNSWDAPIQWLLALGTYFENAIKAVTSIYNPSLGQQEADQSGEAIQQLRSESSVANFSYADNLHRAIQVMYNQICVIAPQIMSSAEVITIVRPDGQHEQKEINQEFPDDGIDPKTGKKGKVNNLAVGIYSVRVTAGPSFQTRQEAALRSIMDFLKINPQAIATPGVGAQLLRMIGEGNPKVEQMADLLDPQGQGEDLSPQQMQQQLAKSGATIQQMQQLIQHLQMLIATKQPEIQQKQAAAQLKSDDDRYKAQLSSLTGIREAEIKAGTDQATQELKSLDQLLHFKADSHEQHQDRVHDLVLQDKDQRHEAAQAIRAHLAASAQQQQAQEAAEAQPQGAEQ